MPCELGPDLIQTQIGYDLIIVINLRIKLNWCDEDYNDEIMPVWDPHLIKTFQS